MIPLKYAKDVFLPYLDTKFSHDVRKLDNLIEHCKSSLSNLQGKVGAAEEVAVIKGRIKELEQKQRLQWNNVMAGHSMMLKNTTEEEAMMIGK